MVISNYATCLSGTERKKRGGLQMVISNYATPMKNLYLTFLYPSPVY